MKKNYVIIVGTGSFVFEDNFGNGVILRSVQQYKKQHKDFSIALFYHSKEKKKLIEKKLTKLGIKDIKLLHTEELEHFINTQNIKAAFISVPDTKHFFYTKLFIKHKIATWLVKPISDNLKEAKKLLHLSNKYKTLLWIDYHKRFDTSNLLLKSHIEKQTYGKMLHYGVQYTQPLSLPLQTFSWTQDTNVLSYIGCHYIDQLEFIYKESIKSFKISSLGTQGIIYKKLGGLCFDTILTTLQIRLKDNSKVTATFQVGWNDPSFTPSKSHQRVEITFEEGRLIMDQKERGMELWDNNRFHHINPYFFTKSFDVVLDKESYSGYGYESVKNFFDIVFKKTVLKSSSLPLIQNTLFSEFVLDSAKKSLKKNGKWIEINLGNIDAE